MFVLADGGMLSEEIITMEHKITIQECGSHPDWPDPPEPPNISFDDKVGVVKHDYYWN